MTLISRHANGQVVVDFTACVDRAAANLALAEDQLAAKEAAHAEWSIKADPAHTRNRIELGAAWCLLAEALEGDRP